jgi:thiamine-phosphate pyrophosphorylase
MDAQTMRLLDANCNRVAEGLRVVEDVVRYCLDHGELQARLKSVRHRLEMRVPGDLCWQWRRVEADVGLETQGELEERRRDVSDLLRANFKRSQQGLRCLEEFFKLTSPSVARAMKELRYEVYGLEQTALSLLQRPALKPGLYLILGEPPAGCRALARMAVACRVPMLQLRCKGPDIRRFLELAIDLRELTAGTDTRLIINDRPDLALLADADGVHLGQTDLPAEQVRRLIGPRKLLGLSTHNLADVRRAADQPVDYIGFGPIYATTSKTDPDPVTGPELLGRATAIAPCPVVAIGGLTVERIARLGPRGCPHPAVIGAVTGARDPRAVMAAIQAIYEEKTT